MAVTFYTDEQTPNAVVIQLRRRGVDVYPPGTGDAIHFGHATENQYVIVTRDNDFFELQQMRWEAEQVAAGVAYVLPRNWQDIGRQVEKLAALNDKETAETMVNRREWI